MRIRTPVAVAVVLVIASFVAPSHAEDKSAEVEALFGEGKLLVNEGKFALACPKFLASYRLDQRIGTLLNLATCYEKNHQLASAWTRYLEAQPLTRAANQQERLDYATERAAALLPLLAHLTIVAPPASRGIEIKRDGALVDPATYGIELPIDTGRYSIVASAPGKRTWAGRVTIAKNGEKKVIHVPLLFDANQAEGVAADASSPASGGTGTDEDLATSSGEASSGPSARKVVGLVLAGAGVVSLGIGTGFGIAALGKKSDSDAYCGQNGGGANDCYGSGYDARRSAVVNGDVATAFFAVGTALVVGGLIVWLTAPTRKPDVEVQLARARMGWTF